MGSSKRLYLIAIIEFMYQQIFPNILTEGYEITSPQTIDYNCIAWAAGDDSKWWWPDKDFQYYWPEDLPREETMEVFIGLFEMFGYTLCENSDLEEGVEKVAIYINQNIVTHAAKQLPSGKWTSKIGSGHDIEHALTGLHSSGYGTVGQFLKRKVE